MHANPTGCNGLRRLSWRDGMIRNASPTPLIPVFFIALPFLSGAGVTFAQLDKIDTTASVVDMPTGTVQASDQLAVRPMNDVFATFEAMSSLDGTPVVVVNEPEFRDAILRNGKVVMGRLPLGPNRLVTLEVEPLRVVGPKTRIVVGRPGGVDVLFPYDTTQVHLFHGMVQGHAGSTVVLSWSPRGLRGHIDLGPTDQRYVLSPVDTTGKPMGSGFVVIRPVDRSAETLPDVPWCGTEGTPVVAGCCPEPPTNTVFNKRLRAVEIAVETDFDLYQNFNDLSTETDYIVELFARTNAIFMRDIQVRFDVVFIRLFDSPAAEPSFMNDPDPLNGYVSFWNANMGSVARDTGTLLSGRRDLPYGGIAYLGAVCTSFGYCVCGYLSGFPDPTRPDAGDYDTGVVAHELGHNFDACHTPDYCPFIDRCYPPPIFPQRGTLMSYCSQTVSGGNLVTDLWYHTRLRRVMRNFVENDAFCASYDCNQNGIDDTADISGGASADTNGNGAPDECEDCNGNGMLDLTDIALGTSLDLNANGIADECEPDCNGNGSPDDRDILLGVSADVWGNGIPDECDPDCDGDSTADYNQIQAELTLDIDRNVVLDACQDCDGDGVDDLVELRGARNAWVASDVLDYVGEYHAVSGVRAMNSSVGQVSAAQDLIVAPGSRVLVSSAGNNKVIAFNAVTGAYLGDFVPAGSGGLSYPTGLVISPNGHLLVCSRDTNSVMQYDGTTGAFLGAFVTAGSGGLTAPFGLTFGPDSDLFVNSGGNQLLEFDGTTGAFIRVFVSAANNGGLSAARGMLFKPDGNLLVASYNSDALLQYDGLTGAFLGKWNSGGTTSALYLDGPWGVRLGPTGNVFATRDMPATESGEHEHDYDDIQALHVTSARIMEFDIRNGQYVRSFIVGDDTGLRSPTGFDFMPGTFDCNFNMLPDDCDIAACSGNPACGDCNSNDVPDSCDLVACAGDPACHDCNTNGVPDGCDIAAGTSADADLDGRPDECSSVAPPPPVADPTGLDKSRFISFSVTSAATAAAGVTALRVKLTSLHHVMPPYTGGASIPFTLFEGQSMWVGPPAVHIESESSLTPFMASKLQCDPHYQDWSTISLLHVTGEAITPSSSYDVENLAGTCMGLETTAPCLSGGAGVSAALTIKTARWGDLAVAFQDPNQAASQPDFDDIGVLVNKLKSTLGAPIKARAKLYGVDERGLIDIAMDMGFDDIALDVDAFKGVAYPYKPGKCTGAPATACIADADCGANGPCILCP